MGYYIRGNSRTANLDTLALWQRNPRLALANDEDVAQTGSKSVVDSVLDVDDIETTVMSLTMSDDANTAHITTASNHGDSSSVESNEFGNLPSFEVNLDGVVDADEGVRVADGARVVSDEVWNPLGSQLNTPDLCKLVAGFGVGNAVDGETALGVVDQAEVLASLFNGDDVHEAGWVGGISAYFAVYLDVALHQDGRDLPVIGEKPISPENIQAGEVGFKRGNSPAI